MRRPIARLRAFWWLAGAASIKVEALRKLGEMLQVAPKATGAKGIGPIAVPQGNRNAVPTLAELGLTKKEAAVAQRIASTYRRTKTRLRGSSRATCTAGT